MMRTVFENDTPEARKALNDLARHQLILKLYADIATDMQVCELEGWDKMEFINMLYDILNHFKKGAEVCRKS